MSALHKAGLPVPKPVDHSRHVIAMEYIGGASNDHTFETARLLQMCARMTSGIGCRMGSRIPFVNCMTN